MALFFPVAKGFNSIRGSFKVGPADLGTHASLVQRKSGRHVLLDSLTMEAPVKAQVDKLTDGGRSIEAIINVHPFHTMHVEWAHQAYPDAKLYGSSRHKSKLPGLPWEKELVDSPEMAAKFDDDLEFSKPAGVEFITSNEAVHFSSVLAFHPQSKTLHVDDTFVYVPAPDIAAQIGIKTGVLTLHPTLPGALEARAGASDDFRDWVRSIASKWDVENLCAAHSGNLLFRDNQGGESISDRMLDALKLSEPVLIAHDALHGKRA